ncbi:MAG: hypothetical protein LBQ35_07205 [Spirochaetaceae bacterium]|jgi:hypothetical protein|nr:hypothetical protein [Spirochaetaceae bacterium]
MKKTKFFGGMVILVLVMGMAFTGCPTDGGDNAKDGDHTDDGEDGDLPAIVLSGTTWKFSGTEKDKQLQFSQDGNEVTFREIRGGSYGLYGTYTITGKTVTFVFSGYPSSGTGVISDAGDSMSVKTPATPTELFIKQ